MPTRLDDRFQHAQVGLVRHQHVDVVQRRDRWRAGTRNTASDIFSTPFWKTALPSMRKWTRPASMSSAVDVLLAAQRAAGGRRVQGLGVPAVGVQDGGEDARAGRRATGRPPRPPRRRPAGRRCSGRRRSRRSAWRGLRCRRPARGGRCRPARSGRPATARRSARRTAA